jgi:phage tail sheath protein FI
MGTFARPGTYVEEVLQAETTPQNTTTAVAAFVSGSPRGPIVPTLCQSWADVTNYYGGFTGVQANDVLVQALYDALTQGARAMYVTRVVHEDATVATLPFAKMVGSGQAPSVVDFSSANPGAWGNQVYVEVDAGTQTGRFSLLIRLIPAGAAVTNSQVVERWADLTLDPTDPRYVVRTLNSLIGGSNIITAALVSGYTYTANDTLALTTNPGGNKLTGGADGSAVVSADLVTGLYLLDAVSQPLVINMPGVTDEPTISAMASYADSDLTRLDGEPGRGDCFIVIDTPPGELPTAVIELAATYPVSDVLAVYYPPLVVPDRSNLILGSTKLVPAGPSVVGRFMSTDATTGPFQAPAGIVDGYLPGVVALDPGSSLRNPDLDNLNNANVNAIKPVPGTGICIYGARTLLVDYVTRYVNARRTLISAKANLVAATAFAPFRNNDQYLWADMYNAADAYLRGLYVAGGLAGATATDAYFIVCDDTINTDAAIQAGAVYIQIGVALQRPAEFVVIQIGQYDGSSSVVTTS